MSISFFRPTLVALSVAFLCSNAHAAMVRDDVDYQYFRDFAENKGQFSVGAKNVPVFNKEGNVVGTMLPNVPMPDLYVASRTSGIATLFSPQYVASVKHNTGYGSAQYGDAANNPDAHHFDYLIVDRNNHAWKDFHAPRLHKLVTEVAPVALTERQDPKTEEFFNKERYPYMVRVGSGLQHVQNKNNENSFVANGYTYLIGGVPVKGQHSSHQQAVFRGSLFEEGLATYGLPGDSGSPLFVYDAQEKRWKFAAVLGTFAGYKYLQNQYTFVQPDLIRDEIKKDELQVNVQSHDLTWQNKDGNSSTLQNGGETVEVGLHDASKAALDNKQQRPSLDNGKTLHFHGQDNATLTLKDNIHQGAGALYFNQNMTVKGANADTTWVGAGVVVNADKTVHWQVKNPQGDRLSKLGTGTLHVNGEGKNLGDISVGDGTVILDQKASKGEQQAFNQVGITSGRATVVLANDKQVNPDNIYFGFRGGRLDLNGNALSFHYIQNADEGARIVNHNTNRAADITITGKDLFTEQDIEWVNWSQHAKTAVGIYEYTNQHQRGRKDYFRLKEGANPRTYFPTNMTSSAAWEFLGNDKQAAIQAVLARANSQVPLETFSGYFGETDQSRPNGALNVTYRPHHSESTLVLSGGLALEGKFNVEAGNVALSGIPVPHAYDYINKKEVIKEDEWINRDFQATQFNVNGNASLSSGRNVSSLTGDINVRQQGQVKLGFIQGQSQVCTRSSLNGSSACQENVTLSDSTFEQLPTTAIQSNVQLQDRSTFTLGKAHLTGTMAADNQTQVALMPSSAWTLTGNSRVGHLTLSPNSVITLNEQFENADKNTRSLAFNQLTVNGNLNGNGTFRFLTNAAEHKGDQLVVNGLASGAYLLSVKNTGKEPNEVSPLSLVKLNHAQQHNNVKFALENGFVDLGAYRYILANRQHDYRLYNPLKDAELQGKLSPEMIAASLRDAELVKQQLAAKQQELARLTTQQTQANQQKAQLQARINKLLADITQTNKAIDASFHEYNQTRRIRFIKRRNLYNNFTQLKAKLEQQRNEFRGLKNQENHATKQVQDVLLLVNQTKNAATSLAQRQQALQTETERLQQGYFSVLERARQMCEAQGLNDAVCRQVAKVANDSDISAFESEIDVNMELVESAQRALELAENQGNAETIIQAQQALNDAASMLLASLENAYSTFGDIEQFLNAQASDIAMPVQAQLISRYANTALSELSANVNSALQAGRNLDRHLLSQDNSTLWANTESSKQTYRSDYHRPYKQTSTLTQLGVSQALSEQVKIGAVLSHSRANNEFDENVSSKNRLTLVNAFVKGEWQNGVFASMDLGYGRNRSSIKFDEQEQIIHRHLFNAGANVGARWDLGINIQPSLGVRYYHLSSANYNLAGADIESKALDLLTYRAGITLDKTFDLDGLKLKPSFSSSYYDASQRKLETSGALTVNDIAMKQAFGRYFTHEVGLGLQMDQWHVSTNIGLLKGSDVSPQKYAAFKFGYAW